MKKLFITVLATGLILFACKEKTTTTPLKTQVETEASLNAVPRQNTFDQMSKESIWQARETFQNYTSEMKANFWIYKLEKWKAECSPNEVELNALNDILPKITAGCFEDSIENENIITYIETIWAPKIQPYINFDRLALMVCSPYYVGQSKVIVNPGSGNSGAECDCSSGRSSDFCAGAPGTGGPNSGACKKTKLCSLSGCGWFWFQRCDGICG
jgi:hypothetical protein